MPQKPMTVSQHTLMSSHKGHAKHLCELTAKRQMLQVAKASRGAKYMCHICGRASSKAQDLCEPVKL